MSSLYLVRHGQASFLADDYDVLSPLGEEQARQLGRYWARIGLRVDEVIAGLEDVPGLAAGPHPAAAGHRVEELTAGVPVPVCTGAR